jgi:hypothetical protein
MGLDIETLDRAEFAGLAGGVSFMSVSANGKRVIRRLNDQSY